MAKDDIKKYGNRNEIDDAKATTRAERLSKKDKNILSEPSSSLIKFGKFNEDKIGTDQFIELHIYDENNHRLESVYSQNKINWTISKAKGAANTGNQLVLKPGDDLRGSGFEYGQFKLVYNIFEEDFKVPENEYRFLEVNAIREWLIGKKKSL